MTIVQAGLTAQRPRLGFGNLPASFLMPGCGISRTFDLICSRFTKNRRKPHDPIHFNSLADRAALPVDVCHSAHAGFLLVWLAMPAVLGHGIFFVGLILT